MPVFWFLLARTLLLFPFALLPFTLFLFLSFAEGGANFCSETRFFQKTGFLGFTNNRFSEKLKAYPFFSYKRGGGEGAGTSECSVVVRGTTMRSIAAVPTATGTRWAIGTGI
ncbi:hypothetical protein [Microseira wollei]|uniref:hypothetical protein n=1 Tax=Microseira wollei TaxID=467598 RepID=UPI001CFCAA24|nr:hypothetical protein [Microseira wollei]